MTKYKISSYRLNRTQINASQNSKNHNFNYEQNPNLSKLFLAKKAFTFSIISGVTSLF